MTLEPCTRGDLLAAARADRDLFGRYTHLLDLFLDVLQELDASQLQTTDNVEDGEEITQ